MDMQYTAVFEEIPESEGGGYVAHCEELPGAIAQGKSLEEARENLRDAISLLLESYRDETERNGQRVIREKISVPPAWSATICCVI
ncbi:MAG: type II toxin-antitoxin system HicB family antitoxin [Acidobacteria bacterium]|nr:type II toxin-antitoxin system HicB family antitoxin [Acidobacteriota bacterium]